MIPTEKRFIIKTNNSEKCNLSMELYVDDRGEEISVRIIFWNKQARKTEGFEYPAEEYRAALAKYRELINLYI